MLRILHESDVNADIGLLDAAWREEATFAFLPDKSGVSDASIAASLAALPEPYRAGHYALLTSGSTGLPKLLLGSRERSEALTAVLHEHQESEPVREVVVALPLTYCYSFVNQYLWARVFDRRLVLTRGLTRPSELETALAAADGAMLCLVGAQVPMLMEYFGDSAFPGVIRLHFAGGRFPAERLDDVRRLFPQAAVFNNYGCAEAMPRLTLRSAEAAEEASHVGWPLPGVEIDTLPEGELVFRSPYGAIGQADADGFRPIGPEDWVATGDLGRQMDDGHVELTARASEVFKRYGEKISIPTLLQSVRSVWPGRAGVYREVDRFGEEGFVLVVAPHPSKEQARNVLLALRQNHPRPHWPLRLESLAELPLLPNGKLDQRRLAGHADYLLHWRQRL